MEEKASKQEIRKRLQKLRKNVGEPTNFNIISLLSYEFGVDLGLYSEEMPYKQMIEITLKNQKSPSQLEKDTVNEIDYYLNLQNLKINS